MSNLTSELNLSLAVDDDDTADYLTVSLAGSLATVDGLFNATTGHNHNGSHQGGELEFLDLIVGEDLTVVGSLTVQGPTQLAALHTSGLATLDSLDVTTTSRFRGAATFDSAIQSGGTLTIAQDLAVGRDLTVARNASVVGTLTVGALGGASVTLTGNLAVGGSATVAGVLGAARGVFGGYDVGLGLNVAGNAQASGLFYQRGGTGRAWDNIDFLFGVPAAANTVVQRDPSGYIQASFINYVGSGVEGGKPTHVIGRNAGDTYLRWWPANALSPPVGLRVQSTALVDFPDNGGATFVEVARLNVTWNGYYQVYMSGTLNQFETHADCQFRIRVAGTVVDTGTGGRTNNPSRIGLVYRAYMAAGTLIQLEGTKDNRGFSGSASVSLVAVFIPESDYPN